MIERVQASTGDRPRCLGIPGKCALIELRCFPAVTDGGQHRDGFAPGNDAEERPATVARRLITIEFFDGVLTGRQRSTRGHFETEGGLGRAGRASGMEGNHGHKGRVVAGTVESKIATDDSVDRGCGKQFVSALNVEPKDAFPRCHVAKTIKADAFEAAFGNPLPGHKADWERLAGGAIRR